MLTNRLRALKISVKTLSDSSLDGAGNCRSRRLIDVCTRLTAELPVLKQLLNLAFAMNDRENVEWFFVNAVDD